MFLAFSTAYGYVVQFKIFSLSVGFGLFHGLVFLPVILNVLGGSIGKVTNFIFISGFDLHGARNYKHRYFN